MKPSPHSPTPLASLHPIIIKCKGSSGAGRGIFLLSSCVNAGTSRHGDGGSDSRGRPRLHRTVPRGPEPVCSALLAALRVKKCGRVNLLAKSW